MYQGMILASALAEVSRKAWHVASSSIAEGVRIGCNSHPRAKQVCRAVSKSAKIGADWIAEMSNATVDQIPLVVRKYSKKTLNGFVNLVNAVGQSYQKSAENFGKRMEMTYGIPSTMGEQAFKDVKHLTGDLALAKGAKVLGEAYKTFKSLNGIGVEGISSASKTLSLRKVSSIPKFSEEIGYSTEKVTAALFQAAKNLWDYPAVIARQKGAILFSLPVIPTKVTGMSPKKIVRLFQQAGFEVILGRGKGGHKFMKKQGYPQSVTIPSGKTLSPGVEAKLLKILRNVHSES